MNMESSTTQEKDLTPEQVNEILAAYDLGKTRVTSRLRSGYANENYRVDADRGSYLLRVCREKGEQDIRHEMRVLEKLKEEGFPAAYPAYRRDGEGITRYRGMNVVIYDFIPGGEPELNAESVGEIGNAVARLNSMEGWEELEQSNSFSLELCHSIIHDVGTGNYTSEYPEIFDFLRKGIERIEGPLREELPCGLIHGDVFPDNTIYKGDKLIAIVDFEEVCTDKLLIDVGVTINGFCFVDNKLDGSLLESLLTSYTSVREMSSKETELLPHYIEWGAFSMLAWHLSYLLREFDPRKMDRLMMFMDRINRLRTHGMDLRRICT